MVDRANNVERVFDWATAFFVVALLLHGADHLRRGMGVVQPAVMVGGTVQLILAAVTVALVVARNRWAPHAAVAIGFVSAAGFTAAHLLPTWGFFSDSFLGAPPGARVTTFSWVTAIVEIAADLIFGAVGVLVLRARRERSAT